MSRLWFDLESFCPTPITYGSWRYAEDAEVMLFQYALDDAPPTVWDLTVDDSPPQDLLRYVNDPSIDWWGQNVTNFDWPVIKHCLPWLYEAVDPSRRYDVMEQAYAHSMPGGLGALCEVMGLDEADGKDKAGRALIMLFCKPQKDGTRYTAHTHPREWEAFKRYAARDITSMREVSKRLPMWNYQGEELELARLQARINYRGIAVDTELATAAVSAVGSAQRTLAARTMELTGDQVESATKRDKLLAHLLAEYDVDLPDLQKSTLERRIDDASLPPALRELLAIRLQASTTSTSKYKTLLNMVSSDGRLRGTQQFCGAARTGRVGHRGFQPGNMPRPTMHNDEIDIGIDALKGGVADLVFGNVMDLTSNAIRGCIVAPPGKKLVVADLSNIEGRVLAWLAGEEWKLEAFRDYDTITGYDLKGKAIRKGWDLYVLAYATAFGVDPGTVEKWMRNLGKPIELASGFGGGCGAFITFATVYGVDLDAMAVGATPRLADHLLAAAENFYEWSIETKRSTFGLKQETFVAIDAIKRGWREGHPATVALWAALGEAFKNATLTPGQTFAAGPWLKVRRDGAWLRIRLPSGRYLSYPSPEFDDKHGFSYMGINQYSRKWSRIRSYGPKLAENVTQSVARDVLMRSLPRIENHLGAMPVLTVHDEVIAEIDEHADFDGDALSALMCEPLAWARGLPLAAAGFETTRYRKE